MVVTTFVLEDIQIKSDYNKYLYNKNIVITKHFLDPQPVVHLLKTILNGSQFHEKKTMWASLGRFSFMFSYLLESMYMDWW